MPQKCLKNFHLFELFCINLAAASGFENPHISKINFRILDILFGETIVFSNEARDFKQKVQNI